jgi:hypothetical protein
MGGLMKTFIGILLLGFLGFLGCSGSNDATSTLPSTFTGKAVPVAPWAIIETSTPTYEWTSVPGATRYRLLVQETNQAATMQDTNETYIIDEWYTAEESGMPIRMLHTPPSVPEFMFRIDLCTLV